MSDVNCPYCGNPQAINHDDGYGYAENETFHQKCSDCGKYFVYSTAIYFRYYVKMADCLNGAEHQYRPTATYPPRFTRMRCVDCDNERPCTDEEMAKVLAERWEGIA